MGRRYKSLLHPIMYDPIISLKGPKKIAENLRWNCQTSGQESTRVLEWKSVCEVEFFVQNKTNSVALSPRANYTV
jgi:hypothetical protein